MPEPDLFLVFVEPLNRAGIPYMVTGSVASLIYGEPRVTHDVDLVLKLEASRAGELASLFPGEEFYCPPEYVIIRKLQYYREGGSPKHLADVRRILQVSEEMIDR